MHAARRSAAHALTLLLAATACGTASGPPASHDPGNDAGTPRIDSGRKVVDSGPHGNDSGVARADASDRPALPWAFAEVPAVPEPPDNPTTDAKVALGRLLFYDPIVSVDHAVACATCHSEVWGMGDGLRVSVGQGAGLIAGPGRSGPHTTRRNAPTLWNVGYRTRLFWDGRAASLEDQVHLPFDSVDEFDRPFSDVVTDVRAVPAYVDLFRSAFPDAAEPVTETTFAEAVAAFERSIVSERGLYDAYAAGDRKAMSDGMVRGMFLFAEVGCTGCHTPPLFTTDRFENRDVAPISGVTDLGRFEITNVEADRDRFEVPTLRNTHDTAPFFHTGGAATLADAIRHEVDESVTRDGARPLAANEVLDLTTFVLKGLLDSTNPPSRPYEVPSGLPVPIDGSAVRR